MKSLIVLLFALFIIQGTLQSQFYSSCLPDGITFTTQSQIDSFQVNYPGCKEIEGDVEIWGETITNLSGLSVMNSIAGNLSILNNNVLTSLSGLDSLNSIEGRLNILYNPNLTSISSLNNLTSIGGGLSISNNYLLSTCEVQWLFDYLSNPVGSIYILNNAPGCNSVVELAMACGGSVPCLPYGNYIFTSQADIDNFHLAFPNCTELAGDYISIIDMIGSDITNLNGLNMLTSIDGGFRIYSNNALTSLTGLEGLTSIGNGLLIYGNEALTSLTGLDGLDSLSGDLNIGYINKWGETCGNPSLTSLAGLEGLNSIGSDVLIVSNDNLSSLSGLDNLTSIGGFVYIYDNDALTSLTGLDNLTFIGSALYISGNPALTSLTDLDNLTSIGGGLSIGGSALTSLTGLDNLTSIGSDLYITENPALTSLTGLDNVASIGGNLEIHNNNSLSTCDADWLCNYIFNPSGSIDIYGNANGCNSVIALANACGGDVPCLSYGNYYFASQADIDNFQTVFPNCTALQGNVIICGSDITNLSGLNNLTSIGGFLQIGDYDNGCPSLASLTGLEGLTSIGSDLNIIENDALTSLTGLEGLTSIGSDLGIGYNDALTSLTGLDNLAFIGSYLYVAYNDALTSLTGLDNLNRVSDIYLWDNFVLSSLTGLEGLTTIRESLNIGHPDYGIGNPALTSLTGLENVSFIGNLNILYNETLISLTAIEHLDPDSVGELAISYNSSLSTCSIPFVCEYLENNSADIHDNAPGCNSVEEVEAVCNGVGIQSAFGSQQSAVIAYPNPTHSSIEFRVSRFVYQWVSLKVYNAQGQEVATVLDGRWPGGQVVRWDAGGLPAGIYYYQLRAKGEEQVCAGKIVKY